MTFITRVCSVCRWLLPGKSTHSHHSVKKPSTNACFTNTSVLVLSMTKIIIPPRQTQCYNDLWHNMNIWVKVHSLTLNLLATCPYLNSQSMLPPCLFMVLPCDHLPNNNSLSCHEYKSPNTYDECAKCTNNSTHNSSCQEIPAWKCRLHDINAKQAVFQCQWEW